MRSLSIGLALAFALGCGPKPPELTPEKVDVRAVSARGLELTLGLSAHNPNAFPLVTRSVEANVLLGERVSLGPVRLPSAVTLVSGAKTPLAVDISVPWRDLPGIAALGAAGADVPYVVEGEVAVGGESLNVSVPFKLTGKLMRADLVRVTMGSLPQLPALPLGR